MFEYALKSHPVDKVKSGGCDHPVEMLGGWALKLFGGFNLEHLKEEKEGDAR